MSSGLLDLGDLYDILSSSTKIFSFHRGFPTGCNPHAARHRCDHNSGVAAGSADVVELFVRLAANGKVIGKRNDY